MAAQDAHPSDAALDVGRLLRGALNCVATAADPRAVRDFARDFGRQGWLHAAHARAAVHAARVLAAVLVRALRWLQVRRLNAWSN